MPLCVPWHARRKATHCSDSGVGSFPGSEGFYLILGATAAAEGGLPTALRHPVTVPGTTSTSRPWTGWREARWFKRQSLQEGSPTERPSTDEVGQDGTQAWAKAKM
jgi:hypothetical protein